jgi:glycerol-3-phosphate dehydrogenase
MRASDFSPNYRSQISHLSGRSTQIHDLLVVGGGVNGCGIARDAVGRGLSVVLCEQDDLGGKTSSSSTKLFHGGLRYLEHYKFRLVHEALVEREVLLKAMPHISRPLRFVLPLHAGMRPAWWLRLGLFIYDSLGGREHLPGSRTLDFAKDDTGRPLDSRYKKGYEYSDCWVDDARLVVLNARSASDLGAHVLVRTRLVDTVRHESTWTATLEDRRTGERFDVLARCIVNATGPWVADVIENKLHDASPAGVRLVRGSHIVVPSLFDHGKAYIFQNLDGRIIFAIPYEDEFTLIGTTNIDHPNLDMAPVCTDDEAAYLCATVSKYFDTPVSISDIVWRYSGVRPLYDDGAASASSTTRDYVINFSDDAGRAPLLNVFGGKITTYRRLAETVLKRLYPLFPAMGSPWTAEARLPGGMIPVEQVDRFIARIQRAYPFMHGNWVRRMVHAYGTDTRHVLGNARSELQLGTHFGATLYEAEVRWLIEREWALTAEDVLWRRTKQGLHLSDTEKQDLAAWMDGYLSERPSVSNMVA